MKVKVPCPEDAPAAIVRVKSGTALKSPAAAVPGSTEIVSGVACARGAPSTVAVTEITVAPASSMTVSGDRLRVAPAGAASLSVMETVSGATVRLPLEPLIVRVSSPSWSESSAGVRTKALLPLAAPAAMVMSKPLTLA